MGECSSQISKLKMNSFFSSTSAWIYQNGLKPLFFACDPELVHVSNVAIGKLLGRLYPVRELLSSVWAFRSPVLTKEIDGISFPNPIGLSAGFDYNADLLQVLPAVGFGFHTIGTITLEPYEGNPMPRLGRFPKSKALLVNKGLKNIGARAIIQKIKGQKFQIPVGISIASTNRAFATERDQIADIIECFGLFETSDVPCAYYELNISCPNTFGGEPFTTPVKLKRLMKAMGGLKLTRPLYIKMPIDQSPEETLELLRVLDTSCAHGVIFGNLTKDKTNPDVHPQDRRSWLERKGNLSGKPTWKRSNALIRLTRKEFKDRFTIIGTGGVFNGKDALEKIAIGADLVQLITGMVYEGPQLIGQINQYLAKKNHRERLKHRRYIADR